jgi:DNA mismatch repair protein MutS
MSLFEDYERFYLEHVKRYGEMTAVFYQNGHFHEIYSVHNDEERVGNAPLIAGLLNIRETRKDTKNPYISRKNPIMVGFNSVSLDRNVELLVDYGYTVVVVNQIPGTDPIRRKVAYVVSPGTNMDSPYDPTIVAIYMENIWSREASRYLRYAGMAAVNHITGQITIYECNSSLADGNMAEDTVARFIQTFCPVEIVFRHETRATKGAIPPPSEDVRSFANAWNARLSDDISSAGTGPGSRFLSAIVYVNPEPGPMTAVAAQDQYLSTVFDSGNLRVQEFLDVARYPQATLALITLLQFYKGHNETHLKSLPLPRYWESGTQLIMDTNAISQLGIIDGSEQLSRRDTVYSIMARDCQTLSGRRLLKHRLTNPVIDPVVLNARYQAIQKEIKDGPESARKILGRVGKRDLDRCIRRWAMGSMEPVELTYVDDYVHAARNLGLDAPPVHALEAHYRRELNLDNCQACNCLENVQCTLFMPGVCPDIDKLDCVLGELQTARTEICTILSDLINPGSGCCKYHEESATVSSDGGCYISLTKPQCAKLRDAFKKAVAIPLSNGQRGELLSSSLHIDDRNKSNVKLRFDALTDIYHAVQRTLGRLRQLTIQRFRSFLNESYNTYGGVLQFLSEFISVKDLTTTAALQAKSYNYCQPTIDMEDGCSYLETKGVRHPLVERLTKFVPLDISLHGGGCLLYGINMVGKSSTMKCVGIITVLAQAGFYVPATSLRFRPYRRMMTRIVGMDDINRGLSTFAVEMLELRSILLRSDSNSLVLGDEVCHGTESPSAVSIVAASIMHLSKVRCSFIFATHLHELSKMSEISGLQNVEQYHLTFHVKDSRIVYDRRLMPGPGHGKYGIEVAQFLHLPDEVMTVAHSLRKQYYEEDTQSAPRQSSYHPNVFLFHCAICKEKAVDTHHIHYQSEADEHGLIGGGHMHMHNRANLVPLCKEHHRLVHDSTCDDELIIFSYYTGNEALQPHADYVIRPRLKSLAEKSALLMKTVP